LTIANSELKTLFPGTEKVICGVSKKISRFLKRLNLRKTLLSCQAGKQFPVRRAGLSGHGAAPTRPAHVD